MRELLYAMVGLQNPRRITPACAGITVKPCISLSEIKDHPRVCGNYSEYEIDKIKSTGSPPRVRELPIFR